MADMAYDLDKLPLGKLSKRTLEQGYQYLKDIAGLILNYEDADAATRASNHGEIVELTNMYLSTIPHAMGRQRPQPIVSEAQLKKEIGLLESLSDMKIAEDIMKEAKSGSKSDMHPLDRQYAGLNMSEMTALDPKSTEFLELAEYLNQTRGKTHRLKYEVEDIFRVRRQGEFERFENSQFGKMSADRRLLWHGSRSTNFGGILSQGLRIAPPEAPASGYMFGKGVYLADMSSKSANYCVASSSGGVGLLLLCEAELGRPLLELTDADYNAGDRAKQQGSHSTWGKGTTAPPKWKDCKAVHPDLEGTIMVSNSMAHRVYQFMADPAPLELRRWL
jgi:poly [ADP-ribose] polymerase